jgi:outer membrane lipoprotein-sorting protein
MSFRYLEPKGDRVLAVGKAARFYDASERRLYQTKLGESPHAWALSFLRGKGGLAESFALRLLDTSRRQDVAGYVLEAVPHKRAPAFAKLLLFVDAKTFAVHRVLFVDAAGNTNRFELSEEKLDAKLPKGELTFRAPPGTEIVEP